MGLLFTPVPDPVDAIEGWPSGGDISRPVFGLAIGSFAAHVVIDIWRSIRLAELRAERQGMDERDARRVERGRRLSQLETVATFPVGRAVLEGPDGRPEATASLAVVTPSEFVFLHADPVVEPWEEIDRIARDEVREVGILDERGEPVTQSRAELLDRSLEPDPSGRFELAVACAAEEGGARVALFLLSSALAADESRDAFLRYARTRSTPRGELDHPDVTVRG